MGWAASGSAAARRARLAGSVTQALFDREGPSRG